VIVFGSQILVTVNLDRKLVLLGVREYMTVPSSSSSSSSETY
jgi:hypothetical protein